MSMQLNNITSILRYRESGMRLPSMTRHHYAPCHLRYEREIFRQMKPNIAIQDLNTPAGKVVAFSPDGNLMIMICDIEKCVKVFKYRGLGKTHTLLRNVRMSSMVGSIDPSININFIREHLFKNLFQYRKKIFIVPNERYFETLESGFCLFTDGSHHGVVNTVMPAVLGPSIFRNNFNNCDYVHRARISDYIFHLVDFRRGNVRDTLKFYDEYVELEKQVGVSIRNKILAILLNRHQVIEIILISRNNKFSRVLQIDTLATTVSRRKLTSLLPTVSIRPIHLTYIKQKVVTYMYRKVLAIRNYAQRVKMMKSFYKYFRIIERMYLIEVKLINSYIVMIAFCSHSMRDKITWPVNDSDHFTIFYVYYNFKDQNVMKILTTEEMQKFDRECDVLDPMYNIDCMYFLYHYIIYYYYCYYFKVIYLIIIIFYFFSFFLVTSRNVIKYPNNTFLVSPLLDTSHYKYTLRERRYIKYSNFIYQNSLICEQIHNPSNQFQLPLIEMPQSQNIENFQFIFHPYEPLAISTQRIGRHVHVNIHLHVRK